MIDLAYPSLSTIMPEVRANKAQLERDWKTQKIEESAVEFEAQFLTLMIENMFSGIDGDHMFGGGHSETIYRSFLSEEYGRAIAQNGGIGLADQVKRDLLSLQEVEG